MQPRSVVRVVLDKIHNRILTDIAANCEERVGQPLCEQQTVAVGTQRLTRYLTGRGVSRYQWPISEVKNGRRLIIDYLRGRGYVLQD